MKSPEYYFKIGADAMQSRIVAILVMKGHTDIAPEILGIKVPDFKEPESMTIKTHNQQIHQTGKDSTGD